MKKFEVFFCYNQQILFLIINLTIYKDPSIKNLFEILKLDRSDMNNEILCIQLKYI